MVATKKTAAKGTAAAAKKTAAKKTGAAQTKKTAAKKTPAKKASASRSTAARKTAAAAGTGKNLVIVESPAKAKTIEKFLGRDFSVQASNGHLRDLPKSKFGVDVDNNFEPDYLTIRGKASIIRTLKNEAKKAKKVYLATDPDREGEAISWHIANLLGIDPSEHCRVEFNEITKSAVTQAIDHPRAIDMQRVDAQQARRVLDRVVGYKLSPLLWKKVRRGLSAGRVQSVAVRIIVEREREIQAFVPEEYWTITASLSDGEHTFDARYHGPGGKKAALHNEQEAAAVVDAVRDAQFRIKDVKVGQRRKHALPPFTTSYLQQAAGAKLGFTAKKTMMLAQRLYEGLPLEGGVSSGLITYMRTDSTRISSEAQEEARSFIRERFGDDYVPEKPNTYRAKKNAQDAHEAIRPTSVANTPDRVRAFLTPDQHKLYTMIYNRFLASQMSEARYKTLAYVIDAGGQTFKAAGSALEFSGHLAAYESEKNEENMLPMLGEGTVLKLVKLDPKQSFTQPPARYTEASLVKFLEEQGIGRPSTYATIISTIQDRNYVEKDGRSLKPTELGEVVTDLMLNNFGEIVDVQFTAGMEEKLDQVEEDGIDWHRILADFYPPFEKDLETADKTVERVKLEDRVSDVICEKCGANMVYKIGRYGEFLACPNYPECKNTKPVMKETSSSCPKCGGKVVERKSKKGRLFYGCANYPECDFVSWDLPLDESCPECGAYMVKTRGRNGGKKCSNPDCLTNKKSKKDEAAES
ncbi:MAG: type I DNA topoisomerase [Clostridia bacterium]|nr:type I DNA topoisomerase [Clostridia bacterium]